MSQQQRLSISSDDINALIYSYLEDSGFNHSSYALRHEARLDSSPNLNVRIPRGELVSLLTKALLFLEVEAHWRRDPASEACRAPFSLLKQHVCGDGQNSLPSPPELGRPRQELFPPPRPLTPPPVAPAEKRKASPNSESRAEKRPRTEDIEMDPEATSAPLPPPGPIMRKGYSDGIFLLNGHVSEVFVCAWHPVTPSVLASGSKDTTVRVWDVPVPPAPLKVPYVLKHPPAVGELGDITTVNWDSTGTRLATGSYDGVVRVWSPEGEPLHRFVLHQGPIFATKWSSNGAWLLTCSLDGTCIVWNLLSQKADKMEQQFRVHQGCVLDADWIDDNMFASSSTDKMIHICRLGTPTPIRTFVGHTDEVNLISFTNNKGLLASASDDRSIRIWDMSAWKEEGADKPVSAPEGTEEKLCRAVLQGHEKEITCMAWVPTSKDPQHILASASFDTTSRIWDTKTGTCLHVFRDHTHRIFTATLSPRGRYIATGAYDGRILVYEVMSGKLVFEWSCEKGGVFDITWQKTGNHIAACLENKGVAVLDMGRFKLSDYEPPSSQQNSTEIPAP